MNLVQQDASWFALVSNTIVSVICQAWEFMFRKLGQAGVLGFVLILVLVCGVGPELQKRAKLKRGVNIGHKPVRRGKKQE